MSLLLAAVGYALVVVGLGVAAHVGAWLGARGFGREFRWFEAAPAADSVARAAAVRTLSVLAALSWTFAFHVTGTLIDGRAVPTLRVDVLPGPAERAGLRDGDRILSVDGKSLAGWDELRSEVRRRPGPRRLEVERAGERLGFEVTPHAGLIAVRPRYERLSMSFADALADASSALVAVPRALLNAAFSETQRSEVVGPVAVVKLVGKENASGSRVSMLALLTMTLWPLVIGVHAFDALTLALFRGTHGWAASASADREAARRARVYQTLLVSGLGACGYVALMTIQEGAVFGNGAMPGLLLLAPAALSAILLVAIAARLRFGRKAAVASAIASTTIPCAILALFGFAVHWLYTDLRRRGYRVSWFVTTPPRASFD